MRKLAVVLLFSSLLAAIVGCADGGSVGPVPQSVGGVAFIRNTQPPVAPQAEATQGNNQLYLMDVSNGQETALGPLSYYYAVDLSHDGKKVVFVGQHESTWGVYVANADGSGTPVRLDPVECWYGMPEFSPDGSRVYGLCGEQSLWSNNLTGTDLKQEYFSVADRVRSFTVASNGTIYADVDVFDVASGVGPVAADGSVNVVFDGASNPSVNAAGTQIAFEQSGNIYVADLPSGEPRMLTNTDDNSDPIFVGDKILFISKRSGNGQIYSIAATGAPGSEQRMTNNNFDEWFGFYGD